jgi:hypothetical protein
MTQLTRLAGLILLVSVLLLPACANRQPEPEPEIVVTPTPEPVLPSLYQLIEQDIAALRLTTPAGNNAVYRIEQLRARDANDPAIARFEQQILQQYLRLIDRELSNTSADKDSLQKALRFVTSARLVAPQSTALDAREQQIMKRFEMLSRTRTSSTEQASEPTQPAPAPERADAKPGYLNFSQAEVENRAAEIGQTMDQISPTIVRDKLPVIIHARNMADFRWLSAALRTSIYFIDPNFVLRAEPNIGETVVPGVEIKR